MRLLYLTDALAIHGGIERVMTEKANWLSEHGFDVFILTTNQGNHLSAYQLNPSVSLFDLKIQFHQKYQYSGIRRAFYEKRLYQLFRKRLASKIKELSPEVIICVRLDYIRDLLQVTKNIPLVFESHSSQKACLFDGSYLLRRLQVWYMQRYISKVSMVVSLTNGDAVEWRRINTNVCVIPNMAHNNDTDTISNCQSKSVIFVGRLCWQKDIYTLLHIWEKVYARHPDWELIIYGEGEQKEDLIREIDRKSYHVNIYAPISSIMDKYKQNAMLLMTSRFEPFGLVLPEAMSCGLPVVAFDCPYGPADIITDGVDGFLVKDRNVEEFVEKVSLLMDDENLRRKMGAAGVQSSKRFSADRIMPMWNRLFQELAAHASSPKE